MPDPTQGQLDRWSLSDLLVRFGAKATNRQSHREKVAEEGRAARLFALPLAPTGFAAAYLIGTISMVWFVSRVSGFGA
jgi:hypothetical protein